MTQIGAARSEVESAEKSLDRATRFAGKMFERIEHGFYISLGVMISLVAFLALVSSVAELAGSLRDFSGGGVLIELTDRLLFVLMLVEILHTVGVSLRTGSLTPEPFLVVGLIASIRRMLVITLKSSQAMDSGAHTDQTDAVFRNSMIELGVLGVLILVMVVSIFLIKRARRPLQGTHATHPDLDED